MCLRSVNTSYKRYSYNKGWQRLSLQDLVVTVPKVDVAVLVNSRTTTIEGKPNQTQQPASSLAFQRRFILLVLRERRFFASRILSELIDQVGRRTCSGPKCAKDLTYIPTKQAEGLAKDRRKHIDSPVSKLTNENVLSH